MTNSAKTGEGFRSIDKSQPLIRHGLRIGVSKNDKLPSVATFIADVKLAIGDGVLERRQLLARISNPIPSIKLEVE